LKEACVIVNDTCHIGYILLLEIWNHRWSCCLQYRP